MDLKEMGESLKNERERQGLSLEDVVEKTKISRANIQNIESGHIEDLPHPVYVKGFVKNYASYLGLDPQEYSRIFEEHITRDMDDFAEETSGSEDHFVSGAEPEKSGKWTFVSVILTIILLLLLGWLVYDVFLAGPQSEESKISVQDQSSRSPSAQNGQNSEHTGMKETKGDQASSKVAANTTSENSARKQKEQFALLDQSQEGSSTASIEKNIQNTTLRLEMDSEGITKNNASSENRTTIEQETARKSSTVANKTSEKIVDGNTLHIFAFEACWMEVQVDNNSKEIFLRPGESVKFSFQDRLKVKLGNAGGVTLKYNGKIYPMEAKSGQVKTMVFPPE